ncbi:MAG: hypothetical protein IJV18_06435 [Acidaminococcaceae bacterium]|nr:hypothetical protein [Acidaminococcaceae bacterium]MBQ7417709.1 hypothetical protein [Acidaminococcaceae bacterium]MBQ9256383.1 hypothetical protein [Acidaminococcaceae bacterium]MBR1511490.1 hypothetical protein [Acidaminococcaceae bacterium]
MILFIKFVLAIVAVLIILLLIDLINGLRGKKSNYAETLAWIFEGLQWLAIFALGILIAGVVLFIIGMFIFG